MSTEKHLFIDTNVWLSLFHFSKSDLDKFLELKKFVGHEINLYLTEQVYDEIIRNREIKIKDAIKNFREFQLNFPNIVKGYEEYDHLKQKFDDLKKLHTNFLNKLIQEVNEEKTPTDLIIQNFWDKEKIITRTPEIIEKAMLRYHIGNPPGKDNKYGDAINWELLLKHVPSNKNLYLISEDSDYVSKLDENVVMPFLQKEWHDKKNADVFFFRNLEEFLRSHYKEQNLQTEKEKNDLIEGLNNSMSFAMTHSLINSLRKYSDFTEQQRNLLFHIANENTQVKWILNDEALYNFYRILLPEKTDKDTEDMNDVRNILGL